ncbi:odorant receptor 98a-like [Anopheles funestus]|uniref:odorant receptor 98a-like n=1 Tax=Anopheles funestus TaxID=62324 RepID=UPI0020C6802B|nr:odorant receptor 98a-like [Anopheles funestus]
MHGIAIFLTECFTWNLIHATSCLFKVLQLQAEELSDECGRKDDCRELKFTRFVTLHDSVLRYDVGLDFILVLQAFEDVYLLTIMVSTLGYCLFQIFSFSYLGTELIVESGAVAEAIFHSTWYNQNVQRQKEICFVVMRANKPVYLTAGKLFTVTRDSFTEVRMNRFLILFSRV